MKLNRKISLLFVFFFLVVACSSSKKKRFNHSFYQKTEQQWLPVMDAMGYNKDHLRNHILLVMNPTACPPCLHELQWWVDYSQKQTQTSISLVLTEKYRSAFLAFVKNQHIEFSAYRDSSASLFEKKFIPTEPIKIYFDQQGRVSLIYPVGQDGKIREFLQSVEDIRQAE